MPDRGESRASEKFECLSPPIMKGNQAVPPPEAFLNQKENFAREKQGKGAFPKKESFKNKPKASRNGFAPPPTSIGVQQVNQGVIQQLGLVQ